MGVLLDTAKVTQPDMELGINANGGWWIGSDEMRLDEVRRQLED